MTSKSSSRKEKIMKEAVRLFAEKGYLDTTTKMIAQEAGVSEGLIFKHFENKDNLLFHLIKSGYRRVILHHRGMMTYKDAKSFLRNMINLPQELVNEDPLFWRMQERLSHHNFSRQQHELFMKPVQPIITKAFVELGAKDPVAETHLLLFIIDALWKKQASDELSNAGAIANLLQEKYKL